jgi:uncharacterized protein
MRLLRRSLFVLAIVTVLGLLFAVPWWTLVWSDDWPTPVTVIGTVVFGVALVSFPALMVVGHGKRHRDVAARIGDTMLGVSWVAFTWSVLGLVARLVLGLSDVDGQTRCRIVAFGVLGIVIVLVASGYIEAMRLPRTRRVDVVLPRLGQGLDGLRVAVLADTHFGPINRQRWSVRVAEVVNGLNADVVCHAGDLADGTVEQRRDQVAPLGTVRAAMARLYITGNHEYFSEAQSWLDHMAGLGWEPMHNRHLVVERDGAKLILAGIDDPTGIGSGLAGHGPDLATALAGVEQDTPILLLAHQPKQVTAAAAAGVDLQISGHTHGGQIWPFHLVVRLDQRYLQGLHRINDRTQLYTSRGAGFWGPPLRVFAPSEITLLTLRSG